MKVRCHIPHVVQPRSSRSTRNVQESVVASALAVNVKRCISSVYLLSAIRGILGPRWRVLIYNVFELELIMHNHNAES